MSEQFITWNAIIDSQPCAPAFFSSLSYNNAHFLLKFYFALFQISRRKCNEIKCDVLFNSCMVYYAFPISNNNNSYVPVLIN